MDTIAKTQVSTTPANAVPVGQLQIIARTRATTDKATGKKMEITTANRSRSILIAEFTPAVSSKYISLVSAALAEAAKQQLAAQWEANPDLREVDTALYSEDSILAFCAREAESKKLTAAGIQLWWAQSELCKEFTAAYKPGQLVRFLKELENLSAPVLSADMYNEEKALKRIVTLAKHERDAEHEIVGQMIRKLQSYCDRIKAVRDSIGSLEEIDA